VLCEGGVGLDGGGGIAKLEEEAEWAIAVEGGGGGESAEEEGAEVRGGGEVNSWEMCAREGWRGGIE
jgi:hypothetical protein